MPRKSVPIVVLGFSDFERQALLSYLRAEHQQRALRYIQVLSVEEAVFVVADGDQPAGLALLQALGRVADTVFVGGQAPVAAAAWLMRPLTPDAVLRELDQLCERRANPDSRPLPLPLPDGLDSDDMPLDVATPASAHRRPYARRADDRRGPGASAASLSATSSVVPPVSAADALGVTLPNRALVPPRALVLDDSEIALHFMQRLLHTYGLAVDSVRFPQQALALLGLHSYGVVFMDVDLGDRGRFDGLKLCHRLRHQFRFPNGRPPMLAIVSAFHDPVDRVRGTLAGAEAFLGKPVDAQAFDQLMRRLGFALVTPWQAVTRPPRTPAPRSR